MKRTSIWQHVILMACLTTTALSAHAQQKDTDSAIPTEEIPDGWHYYDGDEFNAPEINKAYWGIYGDQGVYNSKYGHPQGMIQTYRPKQVSVVNENGISFARIHATRDGKPPRPTHQTTRNRPGWWSGALSSRDTNGYGYDSKMYPLFSRIEIKAKVPYRYGVWMALWLRHYLGASVAELDLEEFFVKYYNQSNRPYTVNQTVHMHNSVKNRQDVNVNKMARYIKLPDNPEENFHVYGVEVDPDPSDPSRHAIIRFLLDGNVTNVWKTKDYGDTYNSFITRAIADNKEMHTWDIAITGQIGGNDSSVGFPEDADPELNNLYMDIDWVRVFTRKNVSSSIRSVPDADGHLSYTVTNNMLVIKQGTFAGMVSVYTPTGVLVSQAYAGKNTVSIPLHAPGTYIVKAGTKSFKIWTK